MAKPAQTATVGNSNSLKMRTDSPDEQVALARKLLDPAYIQRVLNSQSEKNQLDSKLQQALRVTQPKKPLVPQPRLYPRHATPSPRPGSASDVLDALMKVPAVSRGVENVKRCAMDRLKRDWKRLSTGAKVAVISQTVVMVGGFTAGVLGSKAGRKETYELLREREIPMPVPGVPGLRLQLKMGNEHKALILFDIAEFLRAR